MIASPTCTSSPSRRVTGWLMGCPLTKVPLVDDRPKDVYVQSAQRLASLFDVDGPDGGVTALAAHEPDARLHRGVQKDVEKGDEKYSPREQYEINHAMTP